MASESETCSDASLEIHSLEKGNKFRPRGKCPPCGTAHPPRRRKMYRLTSAMVGLAALAALAAVLAASLAGASAQARGKHLSKLVEPPLKDCTRIDGRGGYYGNPWCTPAEQLRWDRWDAHRWANGGRHGLERR
jgi:hypothetical protein